MSHADRGTEATDTIQLGQGPVEPTRFPPGETVLAYTQYQPGLLAEVDARLAAGECPEGRLEIETRDSRLTCLIRHSRPFLAGLVEGDSFSQVPLADFPLRAEQIGGSLSLLRTELPAVMMAAVHFCRRPSLQASTRLVDPAHVLRVLEEEERNAAIAFEKQGRRTLLFLKEGRPARLFFGDPTEDPGVGSLEDRVLAFAFSPEGPSARVEVFSKLKLPTDPDGGKTLQELAAAAKPCPPTLVSAFLPGGREHAQRLFSPPRMMIGRDPRCEMFLDNLAISRKHARLSWERGVFVLEDLGSSNGIAVNGVAITRAVVKPGDRIDLGKFEIGLEEQSLETFMPQTMLIPTVGPAVVGYLIGDGIRCKLQKSLILGRGAGVDVKARGFWVKPVHARIEAERLGLFRLRCFGGAKVKVNGRKVREAPLRFGDRILIGRTELELVREE